MKDCPLGSYNLEQVTNYMLNQNAIEFEKFTDVEPIKAYLRDQLGTIKEQVDMFIMFTKQTVSYVISMSDGCSSEYYSLGFKQSVEFIKLFSGISL